MKFFRQLCAAGLVGGYVSVAKSSNLETRSLISTILQDIESATTCGSCGVLLSVLKVVAKLGNGPFVDTITSVCKSLGKEDPDVCTGAIALEGPILAHALREMSIPSHTSQLFCTTVFGLCDYPAVTPYTIDFPSPKPTELSRPPISGKTPLKIVHISDVHVDLSYQVGANYNCTKNICCRPYTPADAPGMTTFPAGEFGNPQCDSPLSLERSMYAAIESLIPDAAFTMFTGDVVEGAVWLVNEKEVVGDLKSAYGNMTGLKTIYGVVGNHDAAPVNSFPPAAVDTTIDSQWVYDTLSAEWAPWIGSPAATQAANFGAYSVLAPSGVRIISLNTNLWYRQNFWLYEATMEADPSGQFAWLVSELQASEIAGEPVYIMGHMPMGTADAFRDASDTFNQIVQRYEATIAALFFGHTHKDEFEIAYSNYTAQTAANANAISYIAPALTPTSGNPTFRVYDVDPVTFGVLDYTTYFANMSAVGYQTEPVWEKYYSVRETYGGQGEMTPAFWHNVTVSFEDDDGLFQEYYGRKSRGWDVMTCTGDCKTEEICALRAADAQYNCAVVTKGVNFKKRNDVGHQNEHGANECGESMLGTILRGFTDDVGKFKRELVRLL